MASAPSPQLFLAPFLIGVLLNAILYGVMLVQMLVYALRYRSDRAWFRYLALYLFIAETANLVCDVGLIYQPLILEYGNPEALAKSPLFLRADAIITVVISTPVQLFVAWRVKILMGSHVLSSVIAFLSIVSLVGGFAVSILTATHPDFSLSRIHSFQPAVAVWLISTAACDVVLTASLVYTLYTRKRRAFTGSVVDSYLNKIIRLSVHTGCITAVVALLDLLTFLLIPNTTLNFIWDLSLSKLYTNSLLSTLNARPSKEELTHGGPNVLFSEQARSPTSRSMIRVHEDPERNNNNLDTSVAGSSNSSLQIHVVREFESWMDLK
ncbi:hypothetical protein FB45DRAFT_448456 [Roridomyces roridus]|uniref:DUF6534 domain-containing protein n=1 Tax=Roridomyces roridus TaxID=1738132 RepID=A0AAD7C1V7_9AGAR|nr:hypothetical protein FB45DRAFT_448456 [Roridomyces roridus]